MEGSSSSSRNTTRTGYACDGCKRQKVKCSGGQPCQRCTQSGIACMYGSNVGRSKAPYIKHLESQIATLQALLQQQQRWHPGIAPEEHGNVEDPSGQSAAQERLLDTLLRPEDDFVLVADESRGSLYHGHFGGLSVLRAVRRLCDDSVVDNPGVDMTEAFDFPSLELPCGNHMAELALLPPCRRLKNTIITALDSALTCKECIDWDELWPQIEALHAQDPEDFTPSERSLLGLVYALLALGRRHEEDDTEPSEQGSPGRVIVKGMTYFRASRAIVDSQGYTDLYSILTLCCQAGYLMSCSMMSKAYGLICTGISAALRMGLHVSSSALGDRLSKDDLTRRRRVFAVLNITAVILASVLGLPNLLRDVDGSQVLPLAEDDLADEGQSYIAANPSSPISATIRSAKLFRILAGITESRTAPRDIASAPSGAYELNYDTVARFATELASWHNDLPAMSPASDDRQMFRSQLMLRLQYCAVQISLYRPFLHYVRLDKRSHDFNLQGFECGSSCLRTSTQVIHIVETMDQHGFLHEAQWYTIYTLAIAACSLMLFVHSNIDGPAVERNKHTAQRAIDLLEVLGRKNLSAKCCYESLMALRRNDGTQSFMMSPRTYFLTTIGAGGTEMYSTI